MAQALNIRFTFDRSLDGNDESYESYGFLSRNVEVEDLEDLAGLYKVQFDAIFEPFQSNLIARRRLSFVEAFQATGPAVAIFSVDPTVPVGEGIGCPLDVQLAVSRHVQTVRGLRPVGRIYVPMGEANGVRPNIDLMDAVREWQVGWHGVMQSFGFQPAVIRRVRDKVELDPVETAPILQYSVDNTWDTQRRRDLDPSDRRASATLPVL